MARKTEPREDEGAKRLLEAVAGVVGAVLFFGTTGIIVWSGISGGDRPPIVEAEVISVHPHDDGFVLEVRAANRGDETAAQVVIEGTLARDGQTIETTQMTLDYIPNGSTRRGGLFFVLDPREYDVVVRPLGYMEP